MSNRFQTNADTGLSCDVLVIGAGPAGSSAAIAAAQKGAEVVVLDRKQEIGYPVQCAGLVPVAAGRYIEGKVASIIKTTVDSLHTIYPDGSRELTRAPGYVVDRGSFDFVLSERARSAGVRIFNGCKARPHLQGADAVTADGERFVVSAGVIIGADGPRSATGKLIGSSNTDFIRAIQLTFDSGSAQAEAQIVFDKVLPGGYGWLFPAGKSLRLGVGLANGSGIRLRQALEYFREKMSSCGFAAGRLRETTGGLVPAGGPVLCQKGNIILAGDAAGLSNPLTGAGVMSALISGELAGEAAAMAVDGEGEASLRGYAEEVRELSGRYLKQALAYRIWLEDRWEQEDGLLSRDLRKAWPLSVNYKRQSLREAEVSGP